MTLRSATSHNDGRGESDRRQAEPVLQAAGIGRRGRGGRWLFRHVSLAIAPGQRWALQGPSGSGKTQLCRSLAMLDSVDEGEIQADGSPVDDCDVPRFRSRVMYVHQNVAVFGETVEENLRLPFEFRVHHDRTYDRQAILSWLERFQRSETFLKQPASELSGGERQILSLLRAVQLDPTLLLLDEPTAAMDEQAARAAEQLVVDWCDATGRRAVLWITHQDAQAKRIASHLLKMEAGRVTTPDSRGADGSALPCP